VTIDDVLAVKELCEFSLLLTEAVDKFEPKYVNWWALLTGKENKWFDP